MADTAANFREFGVTGLQRDGGIVRDEYLR